MQSSPLNYLAFKKGSKSVKETVPTSDEEDNEDDVDDDDDSSKFIEEDEEGEDNKSYAQVEGDEDDDEDECDDDLSVAQTPNDDEEMLSEASVNRREALNKESSNKRKITHNKEPVKKSSSQKSVQKKPASRATLVVEISSGEEPLVIKSMGNQHAHVEIIIDEEDVIKKATSSKHKHSQNKSPRKAMATPCTPIRKRDQLSDADDDKSKMTKKPQFHNVDESGGTSQGASKGTTRLRSPVVLSRKQGNRSKACEVTQVEDADDYLKDSYSGLPPLTALAVRTSTSGSDEKMVSLKDWETDGADMDYIVKTILTKKLGDGFINPSQVNPADFVVNHISKTPYLGKRSGSVVECMIVGEVLLSNISTPRSMLGNQDGKEYKLIQIMAVPVEYEQCIAFIGEVFNFKSIIIPMWNGGLELKTVPSPKGGTPQSSPT
ncbi:hypothetical protein JAAARDRAFT_200880 [Jaapia argillacea MUCL 33604]|uniref:Uncharacterized protein n=1 Tax=Jaapia argillacea MUCL 33604 TaxID=933084 RepID=A0A067P395_9AGAM|nr:hypothetical protein JAAARDRAFT_200880 [Jaapia argillacea MUCL 33604]